MMMIFRSQENENGEVIRRPPADSNSSGVLRARAANDDRDASPRPSSFVDWLPVLRRLSVSAGAARALQSDADAVGVPFQTKLLASGLVAEVDLFRALACELGVVFLETVDPDCLVMGRRDCLRALRGRGGSRCAMAMEEDGQTVWLVAHDRLDIPALARFVARRPGAAARMRIVAPSVLRRAVAMRARPDLLDIARNRLFETRPDFSARIVATAWQGVAVGAFCATLFAGLFLYPWATVLALHILCTLAFVACVALRLVVVASSSPPPPPEIAAFRPADMPVYTVLVALYREADIVPELLVALGRIVWPRSKLEIKLVCEADDHETLQAIRAHNLRPYIEIVEVPPGGPRTKPKALSYALPMTSGDFVVLYDAEDRPHPLQLVEAWQRFRKAGPELACLQAPLIITNDAGSWISRMFALEYSALFRGLLPWLARRGFALPLGGTSNHFRRTVLEEVGGWDPYNVTEDADLGLRLHRFGYRSETLSCPTFEEAPETVRVWLPQRRRWLKGWAQTWLVHMRRPLAALRAFKPGSFLVAQILMAGTLLSSLAHSLLLATGLVLAVQITLFDTPPHYPLLLAVDLANVLCGYVAFLLLGWWTMSAKERRRFWKLVVFTPVYWMLHSWAAWRAIWQLYRRPFHWDKTPHMPRRRLQFRHP